ncbi:MAG: hypothetical protein QM820_41715 [Minicystis sp.]
MITASRSPGSIVATLLLAVAAIVLGGCDRPPPDAIRAPRKVVSGSNGACALWDAGPMRCWGSTPWSAPWGRFDDPRRAFARPSEQPDASDVAFGPLDGGCLVDRRGELTCTVAYAGSGRRVYPMLRSAPSMRDVRSPVMAGAHVCAIARADGERGEAVWCHDRDAESVPFDTLSSGTVAAAEDGWTRFDLGDVASLALGARRLCGLLRFGARALRRSPGRRRARRRRDLRRRAARRR